jgi:integrase
MSKPKPLTDIAIRAIRPTEQDVLVADGGCLFMRVRPSGSRGWVVRIKRNGKRRVYTLGTWPDVSIKDARAEAAKKVAVERGTARVDVAEAVEQFMDLQIRPKYKRVNNAEVYCRAVTEALGSLSIDSVRAVDVSRMVADYRRGAPVASMRLLSFTKHFLSWAVGFGYVERSPAADIKSGGFGVVEKSRERILTDGEIRDFWSADDLSHVPLLRFLLLTGLRIQEAQRANRVDIDAQHWLTIPAGHAKNGKAHRAYLAPLARLQIEAEANPSLFRDVSPTAVQSALHRWNDRHEWAADYLEYCAKENIEPQRWTPHDLRRTFASRCGDLGVAPHVIAKLLNHTIPGGASLPVYLRSEWLDERKRASELLAVHIADVVAGKAAK